MTDTQMTPDLLVAALRANVEAAEKAAGRPDQAPRAEQFSATAKNLAETIKVFGINIAL